MKDGRALLRESLLWSVPAALALAVLGATGTASGLAAALAWLLAFAAGGLLARWRLKRLQALVTWLESLLQEPVERSRPDDDLLSDRLQRPLVELRRRFRGQEQRLVAQVRMLATLIEALPDPILLVDREQMVVQANEAARHSFGVSGGPVPLARIVRDPGLLAAVGAGLAGATASSVTFSPTTDRTKQFSARIEPIEMDDGGRGVLVALREQTEQVMIERMRSDFVANASHEIRTPLAAVQGMIETLRGPARDDPKGREMFLELMAEETARMTRLVDDLLSLSRIELAAHQPPREPCDVRAVLLQVVERMRRVADEQEVALGVELPDALPPVLGDTDQLHQLFVNLIDNAVKYGGRGKPVRVIAEAWVAPAGSGAVTGRACVQVSVIDQGPGIAREHIPRLTERFYRVDTARSRRLRGTGLGLAIVKHILRRHQGHLAIRSEPGKGSTFSVLLPIAAGR